MPIVIGLPLIGANSPAIVELAGRRQSSTPVRRSPEDQMVLARPPAEETQDAAVKKRDAAGSGESRSDETLYVVATNRTNLIETAEGKRVSLPRQRTVRMNGSHPARQSSKNAQMAAGHWAS